MAREPGYCLHKPTGQAYVRLGGKVFYLGEYGTDLSRQRYNRLKAEWLLNPHADKFSPTSTNPSGSSMAELCLAYLDHAKVYYPQGNEYSSLKMAIRPVSELYSTLPTAKFGPLEFGAVRQWWPYQGRRKVDVWHEVDEVTGERRRAYSSRSTPHSKSSVGRSENGPERRPWSAN